MVVVDDHPLVREGIRAVLQGEEDIELVGWAGNSQEAAALFRRVQPDTALVDLRLPGESGLDIITQVRPLAPRCRFVILTTFTDQEDIRGALAAGVHGYLLKEALPEELLAALRLVARGRRYFDPAVMQLILDYAKDDEPLADLTARELEVLRALAQGLNNREIAEALHVTEHTVKKHVSSILAKLELKDRTQAALYAINNGLGKPQPGKPPAVSV